MESAMRKDITNTISEHLMESFLLARKENPEEVTAEEYRKSIDMLDNANMEQLWSLYKLVKQGTRFIILHCLKGEYMGIRFAGMYVGIELDGYTHS